MKKKLHRKLRQGALNTALCLLCAAACVLTVVAADYLESKYDWQLDYSFNNITTQGEATENLLDSLTRDVRMYAVFSDGSEDSQLIVWWYSRLYGSRSSRGGSTQRSSRYSCTRAMP